MAKFLGVDADEELVSEIYEKCSFKSLAAGKADIPRDRVKNNFSFFRKGEYVFIHMYIYMYIGVITSTILLHSIKFW